MKKKKKQPRYNLVRTGRKDNLFGSKYIKVPVTKPFDREHNDLYKSEITISYKIEASQIREMFGLDPGWKMSAITENGSYGDKGYPRATIVFTRETGGPRLAMEILAGNAKEVPV